MALTLTIGGSNFLPQYKTNSATIREQLQNRGNTLTLQITKLPSQTKPSEGKEIIFKDGSRFLFAGFITRVEPVEIGEGQLFVYTVEATDYTYVLINHNAQKTYENKTLAYIVDDLFDTYIPLYSFDVTNVDTGPTIDKIAFNHINLRKALEKLSQYTNYEWWVDYERKLYFKPKDYTSAPESFTDSSNNFADINIEVDVTQVRNSVVVKGLREETSTFFQQTIVADGVAREWLLREKPKTMQYIKLNTVSQVVGVDPLDNDNEASYDFMFNFQEKFIRCSSAQATPADGDELEVSYKYEVPVIVKLKSALSVAAMQALEGGDGLHEITITDTSIRSKDVARQRALKELDEYANPLINATVLTRTGLLTAGSYFRPGQQLTINLPTWGISTDSIYLIQEVTTQLFEDGTNIEYNYTIRFGGRLLNATAFLESLASEEKVIDATEEIDRIEALQEDLTITESIAREPHTVSVTADGLSIAESISKSNTTPPFKWGVTGNKPMKWGKFEWG